MGSLSSSDYQVFLMNTEDTLNPKYVHRYGERLESGMESLLW